MTDTLKKTDIEVDILKNVTKIANFRPKIGQLSVVEDYGFWPHFSSEASYGQHIVHTDPKPT